MISGRKRRDNILIDAIEAIEPVKFSGTVWRVVREGRDPTRCSRSGGRWDDGTFDVLYTSQDREGALEEMRFHIMRGQPVMPSLVKYHLFELELALGKALRLLDMDAKQLSAWYKKRGFNVGEGDSDYGYPVSYSPKNKS